MTDPQAVEAPHLESFVAEYIHDVWFGRDCEHGIGDDLRGACDDKAVKMLRAFEAVDLIITTTTRAEDGEALERLPDAIPFNQRVEITRRHGTTVWEVYVWDGDDLMGSGIHKSLPAAIDAALEKR